MPTPLTRLMGKSPRMKPYLNQKMVLRVEQDRVRRINFDSNINCLLDKCR